MRYMYENFLHSEAFDKLANHVKSKEFAWYARLGAVDEADEADKNPSFSNVLYHMYGPTSPSFDFVIPIIERLKVQGLFRIKANLDIVNSDKALQPEAFHKDLDLDGDILWVMILYLNDCNGATLFEKDNVPVKSKANRAIIFPASMRHSGCHQTDIPFRYVINTIFAAEDVPAGGKEF